VCERVKGKTIVRGRHYKLQQHPRFPRTSDHNLVTSCCPLTTVFPPKMNKAFCKEFHFHR